MTDHPNLNNILNGTVKKGFYKNNNPTQKGQYIKFTGFGSKWCPVIIYNGNGRIIKEDIVWIDGVEERKKYELIPDSELPGQLRNLEASTQTQPSCKPGSIQAIVEDSEHGIDPEELMQPSRPLCTGDPNPFPHLEKKGGPFDPDSMKKY